MKNPYNFFDPVAYPEMFFGRQKLLTRFVSEFYSAESHSYAIFGGRRFGKTSLLRAVESELLSRLSSPYDLLVVPVYVDLNYEMITSPGAFFFCALRELEKVLVRHLPFTLDSDSDLTASSDLVDPVRGFEDALINLLQRASPVALRIVILIDESEYILSQPWATHLHGNFRALLSNRPVKDYFEIMMAGSSRFHGKYREEGSPLPNVLEVIYLENLSESETHRLVDEPTQKGTPSGIFDAIWHETAGHPFLTQYCMHYLWKEGINSATRDSVARIARDFDTGRTDFLHWSKDVGEVGQQIYTVLLEGDCVPQKRLLECVPADALQVRLALDALCFHGVVERVGSSNYHLIGKMFSRWFQKNMRTTTSIHLMQDRPPAHPAQSTEGENEMVPSPSLTDPVRGSDHAVRPTHVDVLLVTVTTVEAQAVLGVVKERYGTQCKSLHIGNNTYRDLGEIGGARTFMVRSGMGSGGTRGAILTVTEGVTDLSPSAVVMVGIAFGVDPHKQQIGDILVSEQILAYELQRVSTGDKEEMVIIPRGDRPSASARLLARFEDGHLDWSEAEVRFGLVLSGDKLVDNVDFRDQLRKLEPEAIGGEMEGAGLYAASVRYHVDWILVKAICDWADGKKHEDKKQRQTTAAKNAAKFALHVVEQGGFTEKGLVVTSRSDMRVQQSRRISDSNRAYPDQYNLAAVRELLVAAFTAQTIRRFCVDRPIFYPVDSEFSPAQGLNERVDRVIDYCKVHRLFGELLAEVKQVNPNQYAHFEQTLGFTVQASAVRWEKNT